jgi:hypothetical protein
MALPGNLHFIASSKFSANCFKAARSNPGINLSETLYGNAFFHEEYGCHAHAIDARSTPADEGSSA